MKTVTLILVHFGKSDFLDRCYKKIEDFVFENHEWVKLIESDNTTQKENLSKLWNRLAERADTDYICFLNPDVLITDGFLRQLMAVAELPGIAITCPSSNCGNSKMDMDLMHFVPPQDEDLMWLARHAKYIHGAGDRKIRDSDPFGFCYLIKRSLFLQYKFDERFRLYGQDSDLNERLRKAGWRTVQARRAYVWHWGGYTVGQAHDNGIIDRECEKEYALKLFEKLHRKEK